MIGLVRGAWRSLLAVLATVALVLELLAMLVAWASYLAGDSSLGNSMLSLVVYLAGVALLGALATLLTAVVLAWSR